MKKLLISFTMFAIVFAVAASAMAEQTIYLKGTGKEFIETWNDVFYLGGSEDAEDPNVWHLVYTGDDTSAITEMQLTFTSGYEFEWKKGDGFSTNSGGNNPGWVIVAPYDWKIAYVNSGNNNESESFVVTNETGNVNFNISGFHQGSPDKEIVLKDFWMAVHLDVAGSGTLTLQGTDGTYGGATGQGWGFTYFKVSKLSQSNPLSYDIVGNKDVVYGTAVISLNDNLEIVISISGVDLKDTAAAVKAHIADDESAFKGVKLSPGKYEFQSGPVQCTDDGTYTVTIPWNYLGKNVSPNFMFDMEQYILEQ